MKPLVALRLKEKDSEVTVEVAWRNSDRLPNLSTPVVLGSLMVGLNRRHNRLVTVNLATGKTAWSQGGFPDHASLVVAHRRPFVLGNDGLLRVLAVSPERAVEERHWRGAADETWAHLALVGSRIHGKDTRRVLCHELVEN